MGLTEKEIAMEHSASCEDCNSGAVQKARGTKNSEKECTNYSVSSKQMKAHTGTSC